MADNWQQHVINNMLPRMEANSSATGFTPAPMVSVPAPTQFSGPLSLQPHVDPLEWLPPAAGERLRMLRRRGTDAHALCVPFSDIQEASTARVAAANALKRLVSHPADGGFGLLSDDPRVVAAEKLLAMETDKFEGLKSLQELRAAAWQAASGALANAETWLKSGRPGGTTLEDAKEVEPKLLKGETFLDGIARLQRRGREIRAAIHTIQSSCFPKSYCKQRARGMVEGVVRAPDVSMLVELDREIVWPTLRVQSQVHNAGPGAVAFAEEVPDAVGLIAWMFKDALIAALDREIDAEGDDASALTHADREVRIAEAEADLLSTERDICALIWRGQAEGLPVEFPTDISPLAILGVTLVTTPQADGLPPTTPGLSWDLRR